MNRLAEPAAILIQLSHQSQTATQEVQNEKEIEYDSHTSAGKLLCFLGHDLTGRNDGYDHLDDIRGDA